MTEFKLDFLPDYSDEALLEEVRRVAQEVDRPILSRTDFKKHGGRVGITTLRRRFGDWRSMLERAGLPHLYSGQPVTERMRCPETRTLTDEEIIRLIQREGEKLGGAAPSVIEFSSLTGIDRGTMQRRFGSWTNATRAAGLADHVTARRTKDEACFANLLEVWTHLGRCPRYREMASPPSTAGPKTYVWHWGTWRKALAAFVEWANHEDSEGEPEQEPDGAQSGEVAAVSEPLPQIDRRDIGLRLRFRVLQRDRFRCLACGRSPATDLTVKLHVDHVVPFTKGGKTIIENLRSLCQDCNIGKGDLDPE